MMIFILVVAVVLLCPLLLRPSLTLQRAGRVYAFVAIAVVPIGVALAGLETHMERSKTVSFCTSCHIMQDYGRSLHIDDMDHLAGQHYQYNRVPRETACFACHTNYTMYGDYTAKLRGLRHVWVQYFGTAPNPIKLYEPFNNRECLHCHEGARSFVEAVTHKSEPGRLQAIYANQQSCVSAGCHATVHDVKNVATLPAWPKEGK